MPRKKQYLWLSSMCPKKLNVKIGISGICASKYVVTYNQLMRCLPDIEYLFILGLDSPELPFLAALCTRFSIPFFEICQEEQYEVCQRHPHARLIGITERMTSIDVLLSEVMIENGVNKL